MSKKIIALLIVILIAITVIGIEFYYYLFQEKEVIDLLSLPAEKPDKEAERLLRERYPDILIGTISFSDNRVTIETEDEKEYLLWLPRPKSYYENKNIKDGQRIEIRGKFLDEQRIYVKTIK